MAAPLAVALSGLIFGVSAAQSEGHDLRAGRVTDLPSVVEAERRRTSALTDEVATLSAEVEQLSANLGDRSVGRVQREIRTVVDPAGLEARTGDAIQVTLDDATPEARAAYEGNPNDMIVHQQDIQAVANAMWRAGATAVTIQGQRLVSTTGIKCDGNNVTLQGIPYAPPYVIVGVGETTSILGELETDTILQDYRYWASLPGGGVSWRVESIGEVTAPAYDGLINLSWAEPLES